MARLVRSGVGAFMLWISPVAAVAQRVEGRVIDASTGAGVPGALVQLVSADREVLTAAVADSGGAFALAFDKWESGLTLRVAQLGYLDARIGLEQPTGRRLTVELTANPLPLEQIEVTTASRNRWLHMAGFYDRQKLGLGNFITRDDIDHRFSTARSTGDILRSLPRLKIEAGFNEEYVYVRSSTNVMGVPCLAQVHLNGQYVGRSAPVIHPDNIEAIEVYSGVAQIPAQYSGSEGGCGVVLIWLRTGT